MRRLAIAAALILTVVTYATLPVCAAPKHHPFKAVGHFMLKAATLPVMIGGGFLIGGVIGHVDAIVAPWLGAFGGGVNWYALWSVQELEAKQRQDAEDAQP